MKADYFWEIFLGKAVKGGFGEPSALSSMLGWVLSDPVRSSQSQDSIVYV